MKKKLSLTELHQVVSLLEEISSLPSDEREARIRKIQSENKIVGDELVALNSKTEYLNTFLEAPPLSAVEDIEAQHRFREGDTLGEYQIRKTLGKGGFATVYLAHHVPLSREVALKVSKDLGREAVTLAQLEHDHIVRIFSETSDSKEGLRWIGMQYIPGLSLESLMEKIHRKNFSGHSILLALDALEASETSFDPIQAEMRKTFSGLDAVDSVLWIGCKLAEALAYAHSRGILHLDVKPSNVLLNQYARPYLADFNISLDQQLDANVNLKQFGGTLKYMAPEQQSVFHQTDRIAAIEQIDHRADIFSLGMMLKELLGDSPLDHKTNAVLEAATKTDPQMRFQTTQDFLEHLKACMEIRAIEKRMPEKGRFFPFVAQHPLLAITLGGAIPQLVACTVAIAYNMSRIVNHLTPTQRSFFIWLNQVITPAFFSFVAIGWFFLCRGLLTYQKNPMNYFFQTENTAMLRSRAINLPFWGAAVTVICWLSTCILFPILIHFMAGSLATETILHFCFSFLLSSLIALSYTFLWQLYLTLRVLYPKFLMNAVRVKETSGKDLRQMGTWLKICLALILLIPNLAASILLITGMEGTSFRVFSVGLICFGIFGLLFALSIGQRIVKMVLAFTR